MTDDIGEMGLKGINQQHSVKLGRRDDLSEVESRMMVRLPSDVEERIFRDARGRKEFLMRFPSTVIIEDVTIDSVESANRFLLEHPDRLRQKHWRYAKHILDDVAMRGGIRAAWNAILLAAQEDECVH